MFEARHNQLRCAHGGRRIDDEGRDEARQMSRGCGVSDCTLSDRAGKLAVLRDRKAAEKKAKRLQSDETVECACAAAGLACDCRSQVVSADDRATYVVMV